MRPANLCYPPNPAYGSGACRRMVQITCGDGVVDAHLSDTFHEMRCRVRHDGEVVTAIEGETIRIPTTACPAAITVLQDLVGTRLDLPGRAFYSGGRARRHCTHLFDLAVLAIQHGRSAEGSCRYDAIVPDETDSPVAITIHRNDIEIHRWLIQDATILHPPALQGKTLDRGFAAWATVHFADGALEAATILARTWLIAVGRRYLVEQAAGQAISQNAEMAGRCFAYAAENAQAARFTSGSIAIEPTLEDRTYDRGRVRTR